MYRITIKNKREEKQHPQYKEMLFTIYQNLEEEWQVKFWELGELLSEKHEQLKLARDTADSFREDARDLQDQLIEARTENEALKQKIRDEKLRILP